MSKETLLEFRLRLNKDVQRITKRVMKILSILVLKV